MIVFKILILIYYTVQSHIITHIIINFVLMTSMCYYDLTRQKRHFLSSIPEVFLNGECINRERKSV